MKKRLFGACFISVVALSMASCHEGAHNNLACDDSYAAECLDATHLMRCNNGKLVVETCADGQFCARNVSSDENGDLVRGHAFCAGGMAVIENHCDFELQCSDDGKTLLACIDGVEYISECKYGCANAACNKASAKCNCETGENCSDEEKSECNKPECNCETGENCSDEEKSECNKAQCNCETGKNCSDEEKSECNKAQCKCETGENCSEDELLACPKPDIEENCSENGAQRTACVVGEHDAMVKQTCVDGVWQNGDVVYYCGEKCAPGGLACEKVNDEQYAECSTMDYIEKCTEDGIALYCKDGHVAAIRCKDSAPVCHVDTTTNYADCYELCTEEGKTDAYCDAEREEYFAFVCKRLDDGTLIHFQTEQLMCRLGCNDDGTFCRLE